MPPRSPEEMWKHRIHKEAINTFVDLQSVVEVKDRNGRWAKGIFRRIYGLEDTNAWVFVPISGAGANECQCFMIGLYKIYHVKVRSGVVLVQGGVL